MAYLVQGVAEVPGFQMPVCGQVTVDGGHGDVSLLDELDVAVPTADGLRGAGADPVVVTAPGIRLDDDLGMVALLSQSGQPKALHRGRGDVDVEGDAGREGLGEEAAGQDPDHFAAEIEVERPDVHGRWKTVLDG